MTKTMKRFFSMMLALSLVFGLFVMPASATEVGEATEPTVEETVPATEAAEKSEVAEGIKLDEIELSFDMSSLWANEDVEIDEENPAIVAVEGELDEIKVLNAEGDPVPLTEDEKQQILYLYQQYLDHWEANADLLGVQTPFFLSYNDNKDGLGILGEMLVLAGVSVDAVRAGYMKFDDITGMIQNFMYGDALGIAFYGDKIKAARDEVMNLVKNSGAQTDVQKYLVINSWLAQNTTFDMPYIMNSGKEEGKKPMVAETPVKHENYENVYNVIYSDYEKQLTDTFENQIRTALEAEFKRQYYTGAIENIVYQGALQNGATEEEAKAQAEQYMTANADAIAADPVAFVDSQDMFKQEVPVTDAEGNYIMGDDGQPVVMPLNKQLHAGWEAFWEDAKTNGVEVDPVNAPGVKMTVDQIVAQQMDTPQEDPKLQKPDGSYMTPNEAVKAFSAQAAAGLTDGVLNYWQGSQFGALGCGTAVCLGYTKAFTYLVQYMRSDIYGVNGAGTDMSKAENWKDAADLYYNAEGALDINQNYVVDSVRISFAANVTMYGITQENFNSDHFWNAVKVDGQWFYIDPCYTDVYTEVMIRDRVETDGYMNHLYFMFSHDTCAQLYDGYYSEIKTLYANAANDKSYEDSWMSRIKSNVYCNGGYAYYLYDSTDLVSLMEDYENNDVDSEEMTHSDIKLVRHKLDGTDTDVGGDTDYETLIEFNYKVNEDADPVSRVLNPADGTMVENEQLTKLYNLFMEDQQKYSSLAITMGLYNGKAYFNLSNCILAYDIASGDVTLVKEYNTIYGKRDKTKEFGGLAFSVVSNANQADFTVENRPIAAMTIKNDGKMYVSIATNFAFISGKDPHNSEDQSSYGYEFEESNYNPNYSTYTSAEYDDSMYESFGYTEEINDNDEFMWATNFVETLSMSHLAGTSHSYEAVTVEPSCGRNGFTENRCTNCGASEAGSRVEKADSARKHHYVYFEETYYTKKDDGNWNTGFCYTCTECNFSIEEPVKPEENDMGEQFGVSYEEQMEAYEKEKAIYDEAVATAGHVYDATDAEWTANGSSVTFSKLVCGYVCPERAAYVDCLLNDKTINATLSEKVTAEAVITDGYGDCDTGATAIYTAAGTAENKKYEVSTEIVLKAGEHPFVDSVCAACGKGRVTRISGRTRYDTAFEAADTLKEVLGLDKFANIVVANGENFADALSGSYLANKKGAPILLVNNNTIEDVVNYVLNNLDADGTVYLLGGSAAVPTALEEALAEVEIENVKRLSGKTRYETNLAILKEAGVTVEDILICTGTNFADSLSASAVNRPILLVGTSLTDGQKEFLEALDGNKLYIIGGTAAVSADMASAIAEYGTAERLSGKNRYATSVLLANTFFKETPQDIVLAYAQNFPDGLCAGPLAFAMNAPLILTDSSDPNAAEYAAEGAIQTGLVMGGAKLISDDACREIFGMASTDKIAEK